MYLKETMSSFYIYICGFKPSQIIITTSNVSPLITLTAFIYFFSWIKHQYEQYGGDRLDGFLFNFLHFLFYQIKPNCIKLN